MNHFKGQSLKIHPYKCASGFIPPQQMGSHFFMTLVKTLPKPHPNNPSPSACLSDLFRHGIRNKASERPSGRKPREEAHSLEARKVLPIRIPYLMAVFKKNIKKSCHLFLCIPIIKWLHFFWVVWFCLPFEVFFPLWLCWCWHLKGLGGSGSDTFLFHFFPSAVFHLSMWGSISPNHPYLPCIPPTQKSMVTWSWYAPKKRHLRFRGWVPPITPKRSVTFTTRFRIQKSLFQVKSMRYSADFLRQKKIATKGGVLKDPHLVGKYIPSSKLLPPNITELLREMPRDKVESWSQLWQPHKKKARKNLKCLKDETDHVWLWSKCEATDSLRNDRKSQVNIPTSKIPQIAAKDAVGHRIPRPSVPGQSLIISPTIRIRTTVLNPPRKKRIAFFCFTHEKTLPPAPPNKTSSQFPALHPNDADIDPESQIIKHPTGPQVAPPVVDRHLKATPPFHCPRRGPSNNSPTPGDPAIDFFSPKSTCGFEATNKQVIYGVFWNVGGWCTNLRFFIETNRLKHHE